MTPAHRDAIDYAESVALRTRTPRRGTPEHPEPVESRAT